MRTLAVAVLAVLVMAGCGTAGKRLTVQDDEKVAYVNAMARISGAQVHWVHPPEKRIDDKANQTVPQKSTP